MFNREGRYLNRGKILYLKAYPDLHKENQKPLSSDNFNKNNKNMISMMCKMVKINLYFEMLTISLSEYK